MSEPTGYYDGIGGSMCAAIMGLDKNKSPYEAFLAFTDPSTRENLDNNEPVQWGNLLEKPIGEEAARRLNIEVVHSPALLKHPTIPCMQAHVDFGVKNELALLEVKNRGLHMMKQYDLVGGAEVIDVERVLPTEAIQVMHYLAVTGLPKAYLAVLIGGQKLLTFTIQRDDEMIRAIESKCIDFWGHVQRREPPPPINLTDCAKLWPSQVPGTSIEASDEILSAYEHRKDMKAMVKELESDIDFLELRIKGYMKEAEELRSGGKKLLSWKSQSRKEFTVAAGTSRVLR